mgnify:CR=1 FL=1
MWKVSVRKDGNIVVETNSDQSTEINRKDIVLLAWGMLLHDIAKSYYLGGELHSAVGYIFLGEKTRLENIIKRILKEEVGESDPPLNLSDDDKEGIAEAVLLHHFKVDKALLGKNEKELKNKLAVLSHFYDVVSSATYGFIDERCIDKLAGKNPRSFPLVNPFTRIKITNLELACNKSGINEDEISVLSRYKRARERTYEPLTDVSLFEHARFSATLALASIALLNSDRRVVNLYDKMEIDEKASLEEVPRRIFLESGVEARLAWLVVDVTGLWSLLERATKPALLEAYGKLFKDIQEAVVKVIREVSIHEYGLGYDELARGIVSITTPLNTSGGRLIALLPAAIAEEVRDRLLDRLVKSLALKYNGWSSDEQASLRRILATYVQVGLEQFSLLGGASNEQSVEKEVAVRLKESFRKAHEKLEPLESVTLDAVSDSRTCAFCGVNEATESIDEYRYGTESVKIYACKFCKHLYESRKTGLAVLFNKLEDEGVPAGMLCIMPNIDVMHGEWCWKSRKDRRSRKNLPLIDSDTLNNLKSLAEDTFKKLESFKHDLKQNNVSKVQKSVKGWMNHVMNRVGGEFQQICEEELRQTRAHGVLCSLHERMLARIRELQVLVDSADKQSLERIINELWTMFNMYRNFISSFESHKNRIDSLFEMFDALRNNGGCLAQASLRAHPTRVLSRNKFWTSTLEEIKANVAGGRESVVTIALGSYALILVMPATQLPGVLDKVLRVLRERRYFVLAKGDSGVMGALGVGSLAWEALDQDRPVASLSVFLFKADYPLYRLFHSAFEAAVMPFKDGELKSPVRVFYADVRTGFDPSPGLHNFVPLQLFGEVAERVGEMGEEAPLVERVLLTSSYDSIRSNLAYLLGRLRERGLGGRRLTGLLDELMPYMTHEAFYALVNLINLNRYFHSENYESNGSS